MTGTTNFLEDNPQTGEEGATTAYVEGSLTDGDALGSIQRAGSSPSDSFIIDDGHARETSITTTVRSYAERNLEFAVLVTRDGRGANDILDGNLKQIYDEFLDLPTRNQVLNYITDDHTSARVEHAVESDANQADVIGDTRAVVSHYRVKTMTTGNAVILKAVSDVITQSAFISLVLALGGSVVPLIIIYTLLEDRPSFGTVDLVLIMVTVAGIAATIHYLDIPFNVMTGTILSTGIGLGISYSAYLVRRLAEEYDEDTDVFAVLTDLVRGTGSALTDSMSTTVTGTDMFVIAITSILGQFGLLTGVSILYSYIASPVVPPLTLVVWARLVHGEDAESTDAASDPDGVGDAV